ncbi:MAG: lipopolysaccharide export system permease protein lptG [Blastocatellia bacterium]|jgi:LPS export ABC transporter permease LptF/LPS export ABC transporter permease LptG|nr:lipopolysaccharide export system permease protein lptG [Blastocatellia bacterium]
MAKRRLIERYVLRTIFPYIVASLILLTAILFAQQTGRYFELVFHGIMPASFVYGLALALLPTVLVFTIPMAVLSGTIIGLGRMGSDSELVAMRAAGVSTWRMIWPALALGLIATGATAWLNLKEVPRAQQQLKSVAIRSALYKLDSPVEPRTFTTTLPNSVIYVRDGDKAHGQWGRVFIQSQQAGKPTVLVTARAGRIDSSADASELVLQDAMQTTLPIPDAKDQSFTVERLDLLRIVFNTGRRSLLQSLQKEDSGPDEMGPTELRQFIARSSGVQRREASMILHKRLAFSLTPFVFALFGAALALRMRRGSRGFGVLMSLLILLLYYLTMLGGEQMARAGSVPPIVGAWAATGLTLAVGVTLLAVRRRQLGFHFRRAEKETTEEPARGRFARRLISQNARRWLVTFPTLLDVSIIRTMAFSFLFGFIALVLIFNVFTTFELWRFIAASKASLTLVAQYLFYLLPLVSIELFPGSVLVAALMTYALIARRREAVAWWASGQSVYRLMLPGLVFAIGIATASWFIQERVMPQANIRQDSLRARIRGNITQMATGSERRWLVSTDGARIYSYDFDERRQVLLKPAIYEFDEKQIELRRVTTGEEGKWISPNEFELSKAQWVDVNNPRVTRQSAATLKISGVDPPSVFKPTVDRPSQLSADRLKTYIKTLKDRGADTAALAVALQRKYAAPFGVIVMALIGMPLAISFGRKSTVVALCSAVAVSLAFWLVSGGFQQLGEHSLLPAAAAVWTPIVIFACGGLYFISRVRT